MQIEREGIVQMLRDLILEARIRWAKYKFDNSPSCYQRRRMLRYFELCQRRSLRQVEKMEIERGLR